MKRLQTKKMKKKIIGMNFRYYIYFIILICCGIIAFNIHPSNDIQSNKHTMTYIFHDYAGNQYIMNDKTHGSSSSRDYLFDDEIPNDLKGESNYDNSVSLENLNSDSKENISEGIKDNQISFEEIMSDLGINNNDSNNFNINTGDNKLEISIGLDSGENSNYIIKDQDLSNNNTLIIEKIDDSADIVLENNGVEENNIENEILTARAFSFVKDGRVLPILVSRNDLYFDTNNNTIGYNNNSLSNSDNYVSYDNSGITIIPTYEDCMTPRGYKIHHGDSVLAYQQIDNAPDVCNIERRFCRKGKLSGTYTQQGCTINNDYSYEQWGNIRNSQDTNSFKGNIKQNSDGSVTIKNSEIGGSNILDRINDTYSDFIETNNIRIEEPGIEQTSRPHPNCTAPWGEKVKHGQFIQAFKHENGFNDAPCEAQIRLCTMGELMGTYTESTCKTWDTSFIDWVNGSPSWETYSKEKIERVKRQIKNEKIYYESSRKKAERSTDSDVLDKILYILDED